MTQEIWKPVKGYEGFYEISNKGRIRSKERTIEKSNGTICTYKPKMRKLIPTPQGHLRVILTKNSKQKAFLVHRLVAEAFISNLEDKPYVCHKNDIPDDNIIENLYWGTHSDNSKDMYKNNDIPQHGEHNPRSKLTKDDVKWILSNHQDYKNIKMAEMFSVSDSMISKIIKRKAWVHIN